MSANTVIQKIQEKAQAQCDEILENGKQKADAAREAILKDGKAKADGILEKAREDAAMLLRAGAQQASLDSKIDCLNYKHELLQKAKSEAKAALLSYGAAEFCALAIKLSKENIRGEKMRLQVPKADKDKYTSSFFYKEATGKDGTLLAAMEQAASDAQGAPLTLTLGENDAPIDGGFLLCGETYDMDLSLDALLSDIFEQHEKQIADCLFAAGKDAS